MADPREEWHLDTQRLGRRVLVFDAVDSTNTLAAALAEDPANDGIAILAGAQSAGRGQRARRWHGPPGRGVLLSVLFFPPPSLRRPVLLAAWAAVSVCETILKSTSIQAKIKWPNDVLIQDRKVAGVLIEQARGTVAGIGLNVNQSAEDFAADRLPDAGALALFVAKTLDRDAIARLLIRQLDEEYIRLSQGDCATLEANWQRRIGLLGQEVEVECHDAAHRGRLLELSFAGLELEQEQGRRRRLQPETVRHIHLL